MKQNENILCLTDFFEPNAWVQKFNTLWYAGDPELLRLPMASVVGSRNVSPEGLARTRKLTRLLIARDFCIVSGLAEGVDTVAHSTALEAQGKTVAVMGTPIDQCYPKANYYLKEAIIKDGLVLSQFSPDTKVQRGNFPKRNDLMATISDVTIVVEAGESSGTRHQVRSAIKMGKLVGILSSLAETKYDWIEEAMASQYGFVISTSEDLSKQLDRVLAKIRPETKQRVQSEIPNSQDKIGSQNNALQSVNKKSIIARISFAIIRAKSWSLRLLQNIFSKLRALA